MAIKPVPLAPADVALSAYVDVAHQQFGGRLVLPRLREIINLQSLFFDHLYITDSILLHNHLLRDLVMNPSHASDGYEQMFSQGIVIPAVRDSVKVQDDSIREPTLEQVYLGTTSPDMYRLRGYRNEQQQELDKDYARRLDELVGRNRFHFNGAAAAGTFTTAVEKVLRTPSLLGTEREIARELRSQIADVRKPARGEPTDRLKPVTRTHIYTFVEKLTQKKAIKTEDARRLLALSSTLYHGYGALTMGALPAFPYIFPGAMVTDLFGVRQPGWFMSMDEDKLEVWQIPSSRRRRNELVVSPVSLDLPLSLEQLGRLSYADIVQIRNERRFRAYRHRLRQLGTADPQTASSQLIAALEDLLPAYSEYLRDVLPVAYVGKMKKLRRQQARVKIVKIANPVGGIVVTVATTFMGHLLRQPVADAQSIGNGIAFCLGGLGLQWLADTNVDKTIKQAGVTVLHERMIDETKLGQDAEAMRGGR